MPKETNLREDLIKVETRMMEIKTELEAKDGVTPEVLKERKDETATLVESRNSLKDKIEILDRSNFKPYVAPATGEPVVTEETKTRADEAATKIKDAFVKADSENREQVIKISNKELRALQTRDIGIDTTGIVLTGMYDLNIAPPMQQYSNAGDMVQAVDAMGNQVYTKAFEKDVDEADYIDDGQTYQEAESNFGSIPIYAGKITAKVTVEEGLVKLTNIPFAQTALSNSMISVKKKIAKALVLGDGSSIDGSTGTLKKFVGIYNASDDVAPVEFEASALNVDSLVDMMLAYGNDETTGGFGQVLMLSKADLAVLIKQKDSSSRYYYHWEPDKNSNGNTGLLTVGEVGKSTTNEVTVNYVINSACNSMATAAVGDYTMIYGNLFDYTMPIFDEVELRTKREDNGNYTVFTSIYAGGNVGGYKKFVVMKKIAA